MSTSACELTTKRSSQPSRVVVQPAEPAAHHRRRVRWTSRTGTHPGGSRARPGARRSRTTCLRACRSVAAAAGARRSETTFGANDDDTGRSRTRARRFAGSAAGPRCSRTSVPGRRSTRCACPGGSPRPWAVPGTSRASGTSLFARRRTAPRSSEPTGRASETTGTRATSHWRRSPRASGPCAAARPTPLGDPRGHSGRWSRPSPGRCEATSVPVR